MVWYLFKQWIRIHGVVLSQAMDVFMAWFLVKHRICLHGVVLI
jgi:hypothetical protein